MWRCVWDMDHCEVIGGRSRRGEWESATVQSNPFSIVSLVLDYLFQLWLASQPRDATEIIPVKTRNKKTKPQHQSDFPCFEAFAIRSNWCNTPTSISAPSGKTRLRVTINTLWTHWPRTDSPSDSCYLTWASATRPRVVGLQVSLGLSSQRPPERHVGNG